MDFYTQIIKDKNPDVRLQAAYNLPCYYFNYRNSNEANIQFFDQIYKDLMADTSNVSFEIQKTLASSIHETMGLIPYE
jgi:hypothetical protein